MTLESDVRRPKDARLRAIAVLFLVSGTAALIVETTWLRWFRLLFGATAPAASATLVAFFAGHAIGAALASLRLPGIRRPLAVYGVLELVAACWALAVPLLLDAGGGITAALYDSLLDRPAALTALRFAVAVAATLPTAMCFGATLPAIAAAAMADSRGLGTRGSALYGINTLGAAAGTALAAFWLPSWIGVNATYGLAVMLSTAAGAGALLLDRTALQRGPAEPGDEVERSVAPRDRHCVRRET